MEPIKQNEIYDFPDRVPVKTYAEIVQEIQSGLAIHGAGISPRKPLQSTNFVKGVSGYRMDTNGNLEANDGIFRGTFIIGGSLITVSDIANLEAAIDALELLGGGTVALVPDTYAATQSYNIPSGVYIDGNGAVIDFGGGAFQFLAQGTNAYSTGTLAVNYASDTLTGTGTTWITGMVGRSILIGDYWYEITARNSNTEIEISPAFMAPSVTGATYVIATTLDDIGLINITLTNSSITAFKFRYVNFLLMDGLETTASAQGIDGDDSADANWVNSAIDDCVVGATYNNVRFPNFDSFVITNITGGTALALTGMSNAGLGVFSIQAVTGVGMTFTNCFNIGAGNYSIIECSSHGIEFVSGNSAIDIPSGYIDTVGGDAVKLTATSDGISLDMITTLNHTGYAVNIAAATCDNNKIGFITDDGTGSGKISNSGTGITIASNLPEISDGFALGSGTKMWSDLFLANGGLINWNNGDATLGLVGGVLTAPGLNVNDDPYASGWNGDLSVPTKNAVYDKMETLVSIYKNGTTTKDASDASTTQNIAHGLGVIPKYIILKCAILLSTSTGTFMSAVTTYNGTTQSSQSIYVDGAVLAIVLDTTFTLNVAVGGGLYQRGVVTFDATNIIITWTKTSNPTGIYQILWEAES